MDYTTLHYYSGHMTLGPGFFPNNQAKLNRLARLAAVSEECDTFWTDMIEIAYKKLDELEYSKSLHGDKSGHYNFVIYRVHQNIEYMEGRFIHEQN